MSDQLFGILTGVLFFVVLGILVWNMYINREINVNSETYTSCLHEQILKSIQASKITDPILALTMVCEAKKCVEMLCNLTGGSSYLSSISGVDVSHINNTIHFQEQQIRAHLPMDNDLHKYITRG